MVSDINVAGGRLNAFAVHRVVKRFVAVFCTPDGLHVLLRLALHARAREGQVTHGNTQRVVVFHLFMQLVAVAAGDIGEDGNHVFFLRRLIDDHLFLERVQVFHQQLVGHVDRLRAAHVVHRPLNNVFAVFGDVQHAAVGQYRFHPGDRCWLNIAAGDAKLSERLFDSGVVSMGETGEGGCQQGEQRETLFHS